jgi:hypothetical protein
VPATLRAVRSGLDGGGYRGADEYDPVGCDIYELPGDPDDDERPEGVSAQPALPIEELDPDSQAPVPASDVRIQIHRWTAERRAFSAESPAPVTLAVRLLNYPSWEVRVDGSTIVPGALDDNGQMLVPLGAGSHRVEIWFRRTGDRTAGAALSIAAVLAMLGVALGKYRPVP